MAAHDSPRAMAHTLEHRIEQLHKILDRLDGLHCCPDGSHGEEIQELTRHVVDEYSRADKELRAEVQEVHLPEVATVVYLIMLQKLQMKAEDPLQEPTGVPQNIIRTRMKFFRRVGLKSMDEMKEWAEDVSCILWTFVFCLRVLF
jgi:hypothetical protein